MKIYKTQQEVEKDIKDCILRIKEDVTFECQISIEADIIVSGNINAVDINAGDIIVSGNINAVDINARDIIAWNINAVDIIAWNINAWDISAGNIIARDINARDIKYYAFCCVYENIECHSIQGTRELHQKPICLNGKLVIEPTEIIEIGGIKYDKAEVEARLKDIKPIK